MKRLRFAGAFFVWVDPAVFLLIYRGMSDGQIDRIRSWVLGWSFALHINNSLERYHCLVAILLGIAAGSAIGSSLFLGTWILFWLGLSPCVLLLFWFGLKLESEVRFWEVDDRQFLDIFERFVRMLSFVVTSNLFWFLIAIQCTVPVLIEIVHPDMIN